MKISSSGSQQTEQSREIPLTRKQREWQEREQLILKTAQEILQKKGIEELTMERIAAEIEYSKGTVYNHFCSKEEIINEINCRCLRNHIEMFNRARNYQGSTREKIAAVTIAQNLYAQLHPAELQTMQIIKYKSLRSQSPEVNQQTLFELEQQIINIVREIVESAIQCGDLPADQDYLPDGIILALWSMGYGSNLLHLSGTPFEQLGMQQPLKMMWINSHKLLDCYNWQPLSHNTDLQQLHDKLCNELYAEESKALQDKQN